MQNLMVYRTLPHWNQSTLPYAFMQKHNTQQGSWAQLTIFKGEMTFALLGENGQVLDTLLCSAHHQPPLIQPQQWHKIVSVSENIDCQLQFLCMPQDYVAKKYQLSATHSEVVAAMATVSRGKVLDLGAGHGRNAIYLAKQGFNVTAVDIHAESIGALNAIVQEENLTNIKTAIYNIESASLAERYDFIVSTVVLMFLKAQSIPAVIQNMQAATAANGYNLIVCAMSTADYPCTMPFPFTFKENELRAYYKNWQILKYNENVGTLHKKDQNGKPVQLRFATLLAKKENQ